MKYVYPAVFSRADEPYELAGMLVCWEDFKAGKLDMPMNNRIVEPTPIKQIKAEPDEFSTSAFVTLIKVDTDAYRKMLAEKFPASKGAA